MRPLLIFSIIFISFCFFTNIFSMERKKKRLIEKRASFYRRLYRGEGPSCAREKKALRARSVSRRCAIEKCAPVRALEKHVFSRSLSTYRRPRRRLKGCRPLSSRKKTTWWAKRINKKLEMLEHILGHDDIGLIKLKHKKGDIFYGLHGSDGLLVNKDKLEEVYELRLRWLYDDICRKIALSGSRIPRLRSFGKDFTVKFGPVVRPIVSSRAELKKYETRKKLDIIFHVTKIIESLILPIELLLQKLDKMSHEKQYIVDLCRLTIGLILHKLTLEQIEVKKYKRRLVETRGRLKEIGVSLSDEDSDLGYSKTCLRNVNVISEEIGRFGEFIDLKRVLLRQELSRVKSEAKVLSRSRCIEKKLAQMMVAERMRGLAKGF